MSLSLNIGPSDKILLDRLLKSLVEINGVIEECLVRDEALVQQKTHLLQWLKELEVQRKSLKEALGAAQSSKQATEAAAEKFRCLTSPMANLPVEILAQIFQILVNRHNETCQERMVIWQSTAYVSIPIILGQVCSRWRSIVNENKGIWRYVNIKTHGSGINLDVEEGRMHLATRTARWKQQAIQTSQSLLIDTWAVDKVPVIQPSIGSHETPWESIQIAVGNSHPSVQWDIQSASAKSVTLCRTKSSTSLDFFIPLLRYATNINIMGTLSSWGNTPWSSLHSCILRPFSKKNGFDHLPFGQAQLWDLLNAAPYLKNLELAFTIDLQPDEEPGEAMERPIQHTSLKSISLHLHHLDINANPFGIPLSAPSLQSLIILSFNRCRLANNIQANSTWENITFVAFSTLGEHDIPTAVNFLHQLSNLSTFDVQGHGVDKLFTLINAYYHHVPPQYGILPTSKITRIILDRTDIQGRTLVALVEKRLAQLEGGTQGVQAITKVDSYESPGVTLTDWKRVNELLELGRAVVKDLSAGDMDMGGR